jgi:hypothetical protein
MLWSQYKLATMRRTEFLREEITRFPNIANQNLGFLTLQTSEFQKKIQPESSESKMESEFRLRWGSQKLEPKIGILNQTQHLSRGSQQLSTKPLGLAAPTNRDHDQSDLTILCHPQRFGICTSQRTLRL